MGEQGRATDLPPVPEYLDYDLWLGPAPFVRYHPEHLHRYWRQWWAFGGGSLADFGCHFMDLPHWALDLRAPLSVEAEGPPVHPHSTPPWLIVRYEYPARGEKPPVKLTWYHGGRQPDGFDPALLKKWRSGVLFVGDKGRMLLADYNRRLLLPRRSSNFVPPQSVTTDPSSITEGMDSRLQNGRTNVVSIRLLRAADRGCVARQRGLSRGAKDRVGFETAQGSQPSQRGSVYRAPLPELEDLSALIWRASSASHSSRSSRQRNEGSRSSPLERLRS